jgi:hypothetical protein
MKKKLHIIIRGFLYKENWTPVSKRKHKISNFTIDFFNQTSDSFQNLIKKLSDKYDISLYFSTYDTTPQSILNKVLDLFNPKKIFLSPEIGSTQFTTVVTAIKNFNSYKQEDLILVIRGDIILKQPLIDLMYSYNFETDAIFVLCKEIYGGRGRFTKDIVIDAFQIFPATILDKYYNFISQKKLAHAHKIHKHIFSLCMLPRDAILCPTTYLCSHFFDIQGNNPNWWKNNEQSETLTEIPTETLKLTPTETTANGLPPFFSIPNTPIGCPILCNSGKQIGLISYTFNAASCSWNPIELIWEKCPDTDILDSDSTTSDNHSDARECDCQQAVDEANNYWQYELVCDYLLPIQCGVGINDGTGGCTAYKQKFEWCETCIDGNPELKRADMFFFNTETCEFEESPTNEFTPDFPCLADFEKDSASDELVIFDFDYTIAKTVEHIWVWSPRGCNIYNNQTYNRIHPTQLQQADIADDETIDDKSFKEFYNLDITKAQIISPIFPYIKYYTSINRIYILTARPQSSKDGVFNFVSQHDIDVDKINFVGLQHSSFHKKIEWIKNKIANTYYKKIILFEDNKKLIDYLLNNNICNIPIDLYYVSTNHKNIIITYYEKTKHRFNN